MKVLNNKGWGISTFLILVCVILLALLLVAALIIKMFGGRLGIDWGNSTDEVNYIELESSIERAAVKYQQKYYRDISVGDRFVITLLRLKQEGIVTNVADCTGYVEIYKESNIAYDAYLHCKNYTTNGYQERLDG